MSLKINVRQLQEQLPEVLERTVQADDVCVIERNGQPYAVLVSIREWRRQIVGKWVAALGPQHRLSATQQKRTEALLAQQNTRRLTRAEQRELHTLLEKTEAIMLARAGSLTRV